MEKIDYQKQGQDFLDKTGTTFKAELLGHFPYFEDDKESRDVYQITLSRGKAVYSFKFGQSIANSMTASRKDRIKDMTFIEAIKEKKKVQAPSAYDVLAAVQKYDIGTFSDFCGDFGYDTDSRKAEKTYFAVQEEYKNINRLFHDVMEELQEIN